MNTIEGDSNLYRCYHCVHLNDAARNEWCLCTGGENTPVCRACGRCFCAAPKAWRLDFWRLATADAAARRRDHRNPAASPKAAAGLPDRPVILLIDDDPIVHAIAGRVLESSGLTGTLLHAHDGRTGLETAQRVVPELVLTDALLPLLDGRDLSRTLKGDPRTAHVPIVVMTALYKGVRYRLETLRNYHADRFLEKPVSAETLRTVVAEMLALRPAAVAS
ncbi:MAG TPA: response regulator [Thermoanaerobaculia bacterium]